MFELLNKMLVLTSTTEEVVESTESTLSLEKIVETIVTWIATEGV